MSRLPLAFEENRGQTNVAVKFLARAPGYTVFLTSDEAVVLLDDRHAVRLGLAGANMRPRTSGENRLPGVVNYFVGDDPVGWRRGVPTFARVRYDDVYPHIDLVYYATDGALEHDFVVRPGGDPSRISVAVSGVDRLTLDVAGDLVLGFKTDEMRLRKPMIYQDIAGVRRPIAGGWRLMGERRAGFWLGEYDRTRPLVIDPVLNYSTYLGGRWKEAVFAVATDGRGNAYVTGTTGSIAFDPAQTAVRSDDVFVAKVSASGRLLYATYVGGGAWEVAYAIAVGEDGSAYVAGHTMSPDFPTTPSAFQRSASVFSNPSTQPTDTSCGSSSVDRMASGAGRTAAFVAKISPDGSALAYSTYLAATLASAGWTIANSIAVDADGNAYVGGETVPGGVPTTPGAFQTTSPGGATDGFVAKLNGDASQLVYSTFLGGAASDAVRGIAVDADGSAYVTGHTNSSNFPTVPGVVATSLAAGHPSQTFAAKLHASGATLLYGTYLGGVAGYGIAVDGSGNAYVAGATATAIPAAAATHCRPCPSGSVCGAVCIPVTAAAQPTFGGGASDGFVVKLDAAASRYLYATHLGGSGWDAALALAIDADGNAYVTGETASSNFPATADAARSTFGGGNTDAFVAKIGPAGGPFLYSTFLGGSGADQGYGLAADNSGRIFVGGQTLSSDFPVVRAFQPQRPGFVGTCRSHSDAFVATLGPPAPGIEPSAAALDFGDVRVGSSATRTVEVRNTGEGTLTGTAGAAAPFGVTSGASFTVAPGASQVIVVRLEPAATGSLTGVLRIDSNAGEVDVDLTGRGLPGPSALTVAKAGTGDGLVTSSPAGISCAADCSERYPAGTRVLLTARAATGSTFVRWTGGGCGTTSTCTVTLSADTTVTATFDEPRQHTLTVVARGTGGGTVSSVPVGITCGTDCTHSYREGTRVTLTARPAFGSTFVGWLGGGCGTAPTCSVTLTADATVIARFDVPPPGGVIQFSTAALAAVEGQTATLLVSRTGSVAGNVTVQYYASTVPPPFVPVFPELVPPIGSAPSGDYTVLGSGTLTFARGVRTQTIRVAIANDTRAQGQRTVVVALQNPTDGASIGVRAWTTLTIKDDEQGGVIQFAPTSYVVNEDAGLVTLTLVRSGQNLAGGVSVRVRTTTGTATPDRDYTFVDRTVEFGAGVATVRIDVQILNDTEAEGDETFFVGLMDVAGGATIGTAHAAVVTIREMQQTLQFERSSYAVSEGGTGTITVIRAGPPTGTVSVQYVTGQDTATADRDYRTAIGTLTFRPGVTRQTFTVPVLADAEDENNETVNLFLRSPTGGAVLGPRTMAMLTIVDSRFTSILTGSKALTGTLPPLAIVTYTTRDGETIEALGYPGFLQLLVVAGTPLATITPIIQANGGAVVASLPAAGLYTVKVVPGSEPAVLSALYAEMWVKDAAPLGAVATADGVNMDVFFENPAETNLCLRLHGRATSQILRRFGASVLQVDIARAFRSYAIPQLPTQNPDRHYYHDTSWQNVAGILAEQMQGGLGQRRVINIELQAPENPRHSRECRDGHASPCAYVRRAQRLVFATLLQTIARSDPDVRNNTIVVIAAGNGAAEMSEMLQELSEDPDYRLAFPHVKIVGATSPAPSDNVIANFSNRAVNHMVFARGEDVETLPGLRCGGTSFAAPEVARIVEFIWRHFPRLTSAQMLEALDQALACWGTDGRCDRVLRSIPQDANLGGWASTAFMEDLIRRVAARDEAPGPPTFMLTVAVLGDGTVHRNAAGIDCGIFCQRYEVGREVVLSALDGVNGRFEKWVGACNHTGRECRISMMGDRSVTAHFDEPSIRVTPTSGLVTTESRGPASFTVRLGARPTGNVTVPLASSNNAEGRVSPVALTFKPTNWNVAQRATITGVDDTLIDGDVEYRIEVGPATSIDHAYFGRRGPDVTVVNRDNDVAVPGAIRWGIIGGYVAAGETAPICGVLNLPASGGTGTLVASNGRRLTVTTTRTTMTVGGAGQSILEPGCSGSATGTAPIVASGSGLSAEGRISGSFSCNIAGEVFSGPITGNFDANTTLTPVCQ